MKPRLLGVLLAISPAPVFAQAAAPGVARDEAMSLSPADLAQHVLGEVGNQVRTMTRPNFASDSDMRMVSALQDLTFATAPRASDAAGLCVADRIDVHFERQGANESGAPVRPDRIRAEQVYKVIGAIEALAELSEAQRTETNRRCATAGPVIPVDYDDNGQPHFLVFRGVDSPYTALLVLQRAIEEARAGRFQEIHCAAGTSRCAEQLGALDLARLRYVDIGPLGVGGDRRLHRVVGSFLIEGDSGYRHYRTVEVEAEIAEFGAPDPIRRISRAEIGDSEMYD